MRHGRLKAFDTDPASIMLFCSIGNHFDAAVRELKERFPRAKLAAVAPPWRTEPLSTAGLIDNTIEVTSAPFVQRRPQPRGVRCARQPVCAQSQPVLSGMAGSMGCRQGSPWAFGLRPYQDYALCLGPS